MKRLKQAKTLEESVALSNRMLNIISERNNLLYQLDEVIRDAERYRKMRKSFIAYMTLTLHLSESEFDSMIDEALKNG